MAADESRLLSRRDLDFLLHEWLGVEALCRRERYADHSRETFDAVLDTYARIAAECFAPHNRSNDVHEPRFDGAQVTVNPAIAPALNAFHEAGLMGATFDFAQGGTQLPYVIERAGMAWLFAANTATAAYPMLTIANAHLLLVYADALLVERYVPDMLAGRVFGTMCLSEPQAGSSLADVVTRAVPQPDGTYRVTGNKMWISGGDHDLAENIVHLVLAKVPDESGALVPGVQGLSLFLVPKWLPPERGGPVRNDVSVAGLNHKLGYRGTSNCLLNFGEGRHQPGGHAGAVGWRVGAEGRGLACMFHMMNEARIGVGTGAVALGYTGYLHALAYARERKQGRPLGERRTGQPPVAIIEHPDVRRMLLAQKAYVEGGLALVLYCARLVDEAATHEDGVTRDRALELLELLTPIAKSWPSQWCLAANDLAIQVHGGYGYTRDFPVEQFWRDNRLNPIHEGTHGVQAQDLLGRKVPQGGGAAFGTLRAHVAATIADVERLPDWRDDAARLQRCWAQLAEASEKLLTEPDATRRLANATPYLEAFGHAVVGWLWLEQVRVAAPKAGGHGDAAAFYAGKCQAARWFLRWELPRVPAWLAVLTPLDPTVIEMRDAWF